MPKLRRLTGTEIVKILEQFGFRVVRIKGSHHVMQRIVTRSDDKTEKHTLNIPVHGHKEIALGTLRSVYRDACRFIEEGEIKSHFYTD